MSNRTLYFLTLLGVFGLALLFLVNLQQVLPESTSHKTLLNPNHVRGMAISHNQILYTLNFEQQNDVIEMINRSDLIAEIPKEGRMHPNVDNIIIYTFDKQPEIEVVPLFYINNNLVYSNSEWNPNGFLADTSNGKLKDLLTNSYDP